MTHDLVVPFSRRINKRHDLSIYLICRERAMIDVHNFRFQLNDDGVSTSMTGSRSSALSCPRPMTREYESLFFRCFSFFFFTPSLSHVTLALLPPPPPQLPLTPLPPRSFRSLLILCLCLSHIPHGPLFPVRDPLRRVSPGQVLETRGFHRKSIFRPSTLLSFAFLPLSLAFHGCSSFLSSLQLCFPSSLPCKAPRFLV